jgi:hypothetical protein
MGRVFLTPGMPTSYCYDMLNTKVKAYNETAYIVAFVMTGIAFLAFILGCWLRSDVNIPLKGMVMYDEPSRMQLSSY